MKKYLGLLIGLHIAAACFGQDTLIFGYAGGKKVTSKDQAVTYRQVWREDTIWKAKDSFKNGAITMEGSFLSLEPEVKEGKFVFYHINGNKATEGTYVDNFKVGQWTEWHYDGTLSGRGSYIKPDDQSAEVDEYDYFPGDTLEKGDLRHGEWEFYHSNGQLSARLTFADNMITSESYWRADGSVTKQYLEDSPPEFPGGDQALMRFLGNKIRYPEEDKNKRTSGTAHVYFIVDSDGNILNPVVVKSVSETIDAECLRVVRSMPQWTPGVQFNSRKEMAYILPIRFTAK